MKRLPFVGAMVLLLLALTAPAASAATPFLDISQQKGSSAWADRSTCTEDVPRHGDTTCTFSNVNVFVGQTRYNGVQSKGSVVCVFTGTSLYDARQHSYTDAYRYGCTETASVSIAKSLATASAIGSVPTDFVSCTYDEDTDTGSCSDPVGQAAIAVNVQWTGIPPVSSSTYRSSDQVGGCSSTQYSKGSNSDATVAGTFDGSAASFDYAQLGSGSSKYTYSCH